jgi:hypothetical protein
MRAADRTGERLLEGRIRNTLNELAGLRGGVQGQAEIRVCSFVPRQSLNAFNLGEPNGVMFVQHDEHRPAGDSAPVFRLASKDGFWYQHFAAEAARMWDDAVPWPPAPGRRLARAPSPVHRELRARTRRQPACRPRTADHRRYQERLCQRLLQPTRRTAVCGLPDQICAHRS